MLLAGLVHQSNRQHKQSILVHLVQLCQEYLRCMAGAL